MTTTYGGGKSTSKDMTTATEKVVGNTTTDFAEDSKEHQEYKAEIEDAKDEGKDVEIGKDGDTGIIEDIPTEEEKEESSNTEGSILDDDKLSQMLPEKEEDSTNSIIDNTIEEVEEDSTNDIIDNTIEEVEEDSTNDIIDNTIEEVEEDSTDDIVDNAAEEVEEDSTNNIVDNTTEEIEKLSVTPIDSNSTTVGSDIQFRVTGEEVTFNGLEGFNYNYSNGILTIKTGSEATILTVEAVDAKGETILFDININGIVK